MRNMIRYKCEQKLQLLSEWRKITFLLSSTVLQQSEGKGLQTLVVCSWPQEQPVTCQCCACLSYQLCLPVLLLCNPSFAETVLQPHKNIAVHNDVEISTTDDSLRGTSTAVPKVKGCFHLEKLEMLWGSVDSQQKFVNSTQHFFTEGF